MRIPNFKNERCLFFIVEVSRTATYENIYKFFLPSHIDFVRVKENILVLNRYIFFLRQASKGIVGKQC